MDLLVILISIAVCVIYRSIFGNKHLAWFILIFSIVNLFYFQPVSGIQHLDFWIPSLTLFIAITSWLAVTDQEIISTRSTLTTFAVITAVFVIFAILRYTVYSSILKIINIPNLDSILLFIIPSALGIYFYSKLKKKGWLIIPLIFLLLIIFLIVKNNFLSLGASQLFRSITDQALSLASAKEIVWIGYSYFAFRLMHVLIDANKRGKSNMPLNEFLGYLLFFPALLAGPIMRKEDFHKEINDQPEKWQVGLGDSFERISIGLFQKFILADTLALLSMNSQLVQNINSAGWMWMVVILYAFRIYFDFNGYTHITIGIGLLLGIKLPENFNQPLRSPNLTIFWNRWHITLTQWFRAYYFNPLTRFFRRNVKFLAQNLILAFLQISTMILIGFWHGVDWNFLFWGLWIGCGLFFQNQLTGLFKKNSAEGKAFWQLHPIAHITSVGFTFIYISLGWIWFTLEDISSSLYVFKHCLGSNESQRK